MKKIVYAVILVAVILLTSCTMQRGWSGNDYGNVNNASYQYFNGKKVEKIKIEAGESLMLAVN